MFYDVDVFNLSLDSHPPTGQGKKKNRDEKERGDRKVNGLSFSFPCLA